MRMVSFVAGYVLLFQCVKLMVVALHSILPEAASSPVIEVIELIIGAPWVESNVYTLPKRVLALYQESLFPRLGYLGFCWAQEHIISFLKHADILNLYIENYNECLLPTPSLVAAKASTTGWFR